VSADQAPFFIVGVDRSDTARRAAEQAAELAHALDTTLHIVMCVKPGQGVHLAVGSDQEIRQYIGRETEVIELNGQLAIPGFIESRRRCHRS